MDETGVESPTDPVFVTVAVCTYNRAWLLDPMLESMTHLDVPSALRWELLIVDNNCTDSTKALCASYEGRLPIRVVDERIPGVSNARNRALQSARGRYILFTDDDVRVAPNWLEAFLDGAEHYPEAAVLGGPIDPDFPVPPDPELVSAFPALARGFCGLDYSRPAGQLPAECGVWTANSAYRLDAVDGLGFDPNLGSSPTRFRCGEEEAFLARVRDRGGVVIWLPAMRVKHYVDPSRMTLKYLVSFQIGKGEESVHQKPPDLSGRVLGGVPLWLIRLTLQSFVGYVAACLVSRRAERLRALKQYSHHRGMVRACRELARETAAPTAAERHA